jgi:hypothetical protein
MILSAKGSLIGAGWRMKLGLSKQSQPCLYAWYH